MRAYVGGRGGQRAGSLARRPLDQAAAGEAGERTGRRMTTHGKAIRAVNRHDGKATVRCTENASREPHKKDA